MLETTVPSVNSALQRARAAVEERVPSAASRRRCAALGDRRLRRLVDRYVDAWERCDVDAFVSLLRGRDVRDAAAGDLVHAARDDRQLGAGTSR